MAFDRGWYDFDPASTRSDDTFLQRIQVNYVCHRLTKYDKVLEANWGKIGKYEAYEIILSKVYEAIAETYPHLAEECQCQLRERLNDD